VLSFFGLFEISLPAALANRAGAGGNISSVTGIFFLALTLAVVSFSCTGPILGTLLVGSLSGSSGAWQLTTGLAAFGSALAFPFALFAIFPGWLSSLPKSGGWMATIKKVLAFVELALALKFLSNADLIRHWGILKREVFIGLWLIIALSLSIYLIAEAKKRVAGFIALAFALYLLPGLTNTSQANLKLLSGFPPPMRYSIYSGNQKKGTEPDIINDYEKALSLSRKTNKPLLIDFTGWACVNCRKMEEQVWTNPEVQNIIREKFVLVSLYAYM
jgi:thiol:disulfide interchange protein